MYVNDDGLPVLDSYGAGQKAILFAEKLAATIYPRLPRFVRLFLSQDTLALVLVFGIRALANEITRLPEPTPLRP